MSEITRFYRQPSPTSGLGRHAGLSPGLPADPEALSAIVRGLLIHNVTAKVQGLPFPAERLAARHRHPGPQPHEELDTSLDILSCLAATAKTFLM